MVGGQDFVGRLPLGKEIDNQRYGIGLPPPLNPIPWGESTLSHGVQIMPTLMKKVRVQQQFFQNVNNGSMQKRNTPLALHQNMGIYDQSKPFLGWSNINVQVLVKCQGSISSLFFFLHFFILLYVYFDVLNEFVVELELQGCFRHFWEHRVTK